MVIKTELCSFSELKIYPGKGVRFVAKDGRITIFIHKKAHKLYLRKVKAQKITWTTAWRRANKKIKTDEGIKKKKRRVAKVQKAIVGITLEDIKRKRSEKPEIRQAQREAALREIKDRKQKLTEAKKKDTKATTAAKTVKKDAKVQKVQQPKVATKAAKSKK